MNFRKIAISLAVLCALSLLAVTVMAQSLNTGAITGTVTDPSGAVVANAAVTATSLDTGATQSTTTNASGFYRFALLRPGGYKLSISQSGFQPVTQNVSVAVGQTSTSNLILQVGAQSQTVEVSAEAPVINAESASVNTTFSQLEVQALPNPGGDMSNIAQTTPGTLINNTGGYGNFTNNGLPATSNLFTTNGENNMDPYFNINNTGATNLMLGSNEVQEASVISNPYSGQYGQLIGAQVNYVTMSGSNQFHGNAQYWWNGRILNANDWFAKHVDNSADITPRAFSNNNQWAGRFGGPIVKDKTFFFFDTEGLSVVLPNQFTLRVPTPAFANAVVANVTAKAPGEAAVYRKMFDLMLGAPGANTAQPVLTSSGCGNLTATSLPGFTPYSATSGTGTPCAETFVSTPSAHTHQYILSGRVDQNIGANDTAYIRVRKDAGLQATTIDPINPAFNATSDQPAWDAQFQERHIFSPATINQFTATLQWYTAVFKQNQPAANNLFPYAISFTAPAVNFTTFNNQTSFPQGRNVTQYQFIDDFSHQMGNHNWKFGENFRRYDITDKNFFYNYPRVYFGNSPNTMQNFVNGQAYQFRQRVNVSSAVPIATWGMGVYGQDEWKLRPNLTLTLALRVEHNSNPVCQSSCLSNFTSAYQNMTVGASVPYNQMLKAGQRNAFPDVDSINLSPRVAFIWSPGSNGNTVISGGFGLFYDNPAAGMVDNLLANPPVAVDIRVRSNVLAFDPGPNGSAAKFAANKAAFINGFNNGASFTTFTSTTTSPYYLGNAFAAPGVTGIAGTIHSPKAKEWNFQVQQALGQHTSVTLNYVGNHVNNLPYGNGWLNAYDPYGIYPDSLPQRSTAPNPSFLSVSQLQSGAVSDYQGLSVSLKRRLAHWVSGGFNYTWSHTLDEVSNGGLFTYGDNPLGQLKPTGIRGNYGNADYDVRHNVSAYYVIQPTPHWFGDSWINSQVFGGWTFSGKVFWRTGLPFTVFDGNLYGAFPTAPSDIMAQPVGAGPNPGQSQCTSANATVAGGATPCVNPAAFVDINSASFSSFSGYSTQARNQYRGPRYFDMDMSLFKNFKIRERMTFSVGAQAFNVFNHPNFGQPDNYLGDDTFGQMTTMAATPTSPYGAFLGFNSGPRVVQVSGKISF